MSGPKIRAARKEQLSSSEYYNPKLKLAFIKQYRDGKSPGCQWNSIFLRTYPIESSQDKDCCNFTYEEIESLLYSFRSSSSGTLAVKLSLLRSYTEYCISAGWSKDNMNHYAEFSRNDLDKFVDKKKAELYFITEKQIDEILNKQNSYRDRFLILAVYNGLIGDKCEDIIELRKSDLKEDNNLFIRSTGEIRKISPKLYNAIEYAADETEFHPINGSTWKLINDGDKVFKVTSTETARDIIDESVVRKRFEKIKKTLDMPAFSYKSIQKSGFYNQIKKLVKKWGTDVSHVLVSEEGQTLKFNYNMPKSDIAVIRGYKEYSDYVDRQI